MSFLSIILVSLSSLLWMCARWILAHKQPVHCIGFFVQSLWLCTVRWSVVVEHVHHGVQLHYVNIKVSVAY